MSQDYASQSTEENPQMMAFFDSLVQREIEGWDSGDEEREEETSSETDALSEDSEVGLSDFSRHEIATGAQRREIMERISVSISDDRLQGGSPVAVASSTGRW